MKCKTNCTHVVLTIDDHFIERAVACKKGYNMDTCTRNINIKRMERAIDTIEELD